MTGVRVSSVDPGLVDTEFSQVRFHGDVERARTVYQGLEPLHAEDVAEALIFCATRPPHANVREMVLHLDHRQRRAFSILTGVVIGMQITYDRFGHNLEEFDQVAHRPG